MIDSTTFATLRIASMTLDVPPALGRQTLRDGTVIDNSVGADLWQGEFTLVAARHVDQAQAEALLRYVTRVGRFMLAYDARRCGPASDPAGVGLAGLTPTIHTLDADNRRMRVTGLPAGYTLTVGDHIGWIYAGRYALHRIVTPVAASGIGITPLFEVDPHIRAGATVGLPVTLKRPPAKFRITEMQPGQGRGRITSGPTFSLIQTLGA